MESPSDTQVYVAFEVVLAEFSRSRESLVKSLGIAAASSNYETVSELTKRLKRADLLSDELERVKRDWQAVFHPESFNAEPQSPREYATKYVPNQYELGIPTLRALRTLGGRSTRREIAEKVIEQMGLTGEITEQLHEGGPQTELEHQLAWSRSVLKACGLLDNPRPGEWELTELGDSLQWMEADKLERYYRRCLNLRRQVERG